MVHFKEQFEHQKIPEWYNYYINYRVLKKILDDNRDQVKRGGLTKLQGLYKYDSHKGVVKRINF